MSDIQWARPFPHRALDAKLGILGEIAIQAAVSSMAAVVYCSSQALAKSNLTSEAGADWVNRSSRAVSFGSDVYYDYLVIILERTTCSLPFRRMVYAVFFDL